MSDTSRLKAIHTYANQGFLFVQPDSAFYFAQLEYDFATKKKLKKEQANALNTQGNCLSIQGNNHKAIEYYSKSLKLREEINDEIGIAFSLNNFGLVYKERGDYSKAIIYYTRSLKMLEKLKDKRGTALALNNIGVIYDEQGESLLSLDYYTRSIELNKEIGNKRGIARTLHNIGIIYSNKLEYSKSLENHLQSLDLYTELNDLNGIAMAQGAIGKLYRETHEYDKALFHLTAGLKTNEKLNYKHGIASSLVNLGVYYEDVSKPNTAIEYCLKSMKLAQEMESYLQINQAAYTLWINYKSIGKHHDALKMYELYNETRDSMKSESNQKEIIRQEYKYTYEKQLAEDSVVNAEAQKVKDALLSAEKAENKQHQLESKQQKQQAYFLYGGLGLALLFGGFIFNRFRVTNKQKGTIEEQKEQVDKAFDELEEKNKEIMDSINYAKRIQSAILPPKKIVKEYLQESFILYKPKDIVAGDFYWLETSTPPSPSQNPIILFAAADCTGHGVPGAMVSVICNNGLNRSVREHGLTDPGKILDKTREIVIEEFEKSEDDVKDGMDIALCSLEFLVPNSSFTSGNLITENQQGTESVVQKTVAMLEYAGAHNPLWIIRNGEIIETKANKQPIGKFDNLLPYTTHTFELEKGDSIYIFSDGYPDQFGGERGKKYKSGNFKIFLLSIQEHSMEKQRELLDKEFETWRGKIEQIDDVCVIGVRI